MAQTEMEAKAKSHQRQHEDDEDEVSELQKLQPRNNDIYDKVYEQAERFASTRLGQFVIERVDRALKTIEDTAKWSLPQEKNAVPLDRPLSWTTFLLLIMLLRVARIWLSIGALMIGNGPVNPTDLIYFIQTRRRKLRAIRVQGLKVIRQRQQDSLASSARSYAKQLSVWWSRAICRPGVQRANSGRLFNIRSGVGVRIERESNQGQQTVSKRPRDEERSLDHNLTIDEMLAKYANENSEDDSDFVPNPDDESDSSGNTSSSETNSEISGSEQENDNVVHNDHSVLIVENGRKMPKPMVEVKVKTEPISDVDSEREKTERNGNGNRNDHKEQAQPTDVAAERLSKDEQWKASPGHVSAAMVNPRLYNNTAAAGSPSAVNTVSCFGPQSILKNATVQSVAVHPTPNIEPDVQHSEASDVEAAVKKHITLAHQQQQPQQQQQQQPQSYLQQQQQQQRQHQRYRGRNRR